MTMPSASTSAVYDTPGPFSVPAAEVGRCMVDDDRLRAAVASFDFVGETVVIIGGGGFVGVHIARLFLNCAKPPAELRLFDMRAPAEADTLVAKADAAAAATATGVPRTRVVVRTGDVSNAADIDSAIAAATVVLHVASYGMSGKEMLDVTRIRQVNVTGTDNVIASCRKHHVKALVYTSSYNAVFCGKPFTDATDLPYPKSEEFLDEYSRTKSVAEQHVLAASGVKAVALRMAGIYGVGERRHFPRIMRLVRWGAVKMTVGGLECRQEWVSVANVAYAHLLAAWRLLTAPDVVAGKAYPISEHCPVNQYRMLEPLFLALGNPLPRLNLPVWFALIVAGVMDAVLQLLRPVVAIEPILTRGEVLKVGVEHYFRPEAATGNGLGYRPVVPFREGIARTLAAFIAEDRAQQQTGTSSTAGLDATKVWATVVVCALAMAWWTFLAGASPLV
jgi:nucleoside-diphosphate-sugar epimerase